MAHWSDDNAATGYWYFQQALETLSLEPDVQCERMGNYNVARELKDEVGAGSYPAIGRVLDERQALALLGLLGGLQRIPATVLVPATGHEANLAAMSHPCWLPLRSAAANLYRELALLTAECADYLKVSGLASNPTFQRTATPPLN